MVECEIYICHIRQPLSESNTCSSKERWDDVIRNEKNELMLTRIVIDRESVHRLQKTQHKKHKGSLPPTIH